MKDQFRIDSLKIHLHPVRVAQLLDEVFEIVKGAIDRNEVEDILKGPVAHSGFQRLN